MDKSLLKPEDEVALRDPKCSWNVFKGIVTHITPGKQGIWVAVNYRYGLLPNQCAKNKDKWVLLRTDGRSIVDYWDRFQKIIDKQSANTRKRQAELKEMHARVGRVKELLKAKGLRVESRLGAIVMPFEDVEKLLGV